MKNFSYYDEKLTDDLKPIAIWVEDLFAGRTNMLPPTIDKPIYAKQLMFMIRNNFTVTSFNEQHLRVIVHHLRHKSETPILSSHKGYYTSSDKKEIQKVIDSLEIRANGVLSAARGLRRFT